MTIEQEIREHLNRSAAALVEPQERLGAVRRRGRRRRTAQGAVLGIAVLAAAASAPVLLGRLDQSRVDLAPANPGTTIVPTETSSEAGSPEPGTSTLPTVALEDLGAPALTYKGRNVTVHDGGEPYGFEALSRVDMALPDGAGGVVIQRDSILEWVSEFSRDGFRDQGKLVEANGLALRSMLPDGRVLYSDAADGENGEVTVRFYGLELAQGATPEMMGKYTAHDSGVEGPTRTVEGFVHGGCHLLCSLYRGFVEPQGEALYHGGGDDEGTTASIDGLTSTPDGQTIAFVESNSFQPISKRNPLVLVLLDGSSFKTAARIELPVDPGAEEAFDELFIPPIVSISADGQRVLVTTERPYVVEGALTGDPRISTVDFVGTVRWLDPEAANAQ